MSRQYFHIILNDSSILILVQNSVQKCHHELFSVNWFMSHYVVKSLVTCNHCNFDAFDRYLLTSLAEVLSLGRAARNVVLKGQTNKPMMMNSDSLLSFCSLYLCTVLVYLLKQLFFTCWSNFSERWPAGRQAIFQLAAVAQGDSSKLGRVPGDIRRHFLPLIGLQRHSSRLLRWALLVARRTQKKRALLVYVQNCDILVWVATSFSRQISIHGTSCT